MVPPLLDCAFWVGGLAVEWLSLVERCRVASAETVLCSLFLLGFLSA